VFLEKAVIFVGVTGPLVQVVKTEEVRVEGVVDPVLRVELRYCRADF